MTSHAQAAWFAVDWGTSNLRAWAIDGDGKLIAALVSDQGMGVLEQHQFEQALLDLIAPYLGMQTVPVICCGMVGARRGWAEAPYIATPCSPPDGKSAIRVTANDPRLDIRILPGIKQLQPADVMRGEETQIAGLLAEFPDFDGIVCLPGTHTKWVHISANEIVSFQTFMTGELYALLSEHSVLRHTLVGEDWDQDVFLAAVTAGGERPQALSARLFGLRAGSLVNPDAKTTGRACLSGMLIGAEIAAAKPYWLGQNVMIIGTDALAKNYANALQQLGFGAMPVTANGDNLGLKGLVRAYASYNDGELSQ